MPPVSPLWSIPFLLLLACIALMPFINKHWWEKWYPAVALGLGAVVAVYYCLLASLRGLWLERMAEYLSFIILLWSLYVISGGIVIHVHRKATPLVNCGLLLIGALIANIFGTTGASMLLIRPYIRINRGHIKPYHIVFFIFIVSNVGGLLTPIGDPPLFLGYLQGVPFWWVLKTCRWIWVLTVGILLAIFFMIDWLDHGRSERQPPESVGAIVHVLGIQNILLIAVVVWAVFQPGLLDVIHLIHEKGARPSLLARLPLSREVLMAVAGAASILLTGKAIHQRNQFSYAPIREVAILFAGIFSAMVPALHWLSANANAMPLTTPGQVYFASGTLSAVLDNAPTYLTFLEARLGRLDQAKVDLAVAELKRMASEGDLRVPPSVDEDVREALAVLVQYHPNEVRDDAVTREQVEVAFLLGDAMLSRYIIAISVAAVFFGACTYIGNGPNFMVKSIADAAGVRTPSFLAYILYYTLPILVPVYVLVWLLLAMGVGTP